MELSVIAAVVLLLNVSALALKRRCREEGHEKQN